MASIPQYIFQAEIFRYGDDSKPIKKISILAASILHATHVLDKLVYEGEMFEFPVEIGNISKNYEVGKIENGYMSDVDDEDSLEEIEDDETDSGKEEQPPQNNISQKERLKRAKAATKQIFHLSKRATKNELFSFKCICGEPLTLAKNILWDYMACPHCENIIERNDLEEIGGIWLYTKLEKGKDDGSGKQSKI